MINIKNYNILLLLIGGLLLSILTNNALALPMQARQEPAAATGNPNGGTWQIVGTTGVNAMHMFLSSPNKLVFVDKIENNPIQQSQGVPAISAEYDLDTNQVRALNVVSNTFCSAGSWLGNGIMLHSGGDGGNAKIADGQQTLRFYDPATQIWDEKVGLLLSKRWYPTMLPLTNGRVLILGGSTGGTGLNNADLNNPTYNIWPPKNNGNTPDPDVPFPFLTETLPYNLYVFVHLVPNANGGNNLFVFANQQGILFNLDTATVLATYPKLDITRSYPHTGTSTMLPLRPEDNYRPVVMICGGQAVQEITSPAADSCGRLDLSVANPTWQMSNFGGIPRVMPDSVILVNGQVLFLNGAQTGYAGFRKGSADNPLWANSNPAFNPVLYDPTSNQFTKMNPSTIARMYHSTATLLPDGSVAVAGSNPQPNVAKNLLFPTEYRLEIYKPPYLLNGAPRPTIVSVNGTAINQGRIPVSYGQSIVLVVQMTTTTTTPSFNAAIIHHGFITHSQNMGQRYAGLVISSAVIDSSIANQYYLTVTLPPNPSIIAPGPHFIYVLGNDAPCVSGAEVLLN